MQRVAPVARDMSNRQRQEGAAAAENRLADFQPRLIAGPERDHRLVLLGDDGDAVLDFFAGSAVQLNGVLAQFHARRLDQTERLEQLLHPGNAGRGWATNGIGPAVGLVPARDGAIFDQGSRLLRRIVRLLRQSPRTERAGAHPRREWLHRHPDADGHRHRAAARFKANLPLLRLLERTQLASDDADPQHGPIGELETACSHAPSPVPQRKPRHIANGRAIEEPLSPALCSTSSSGLLISADAHRPKVEGGRLDAQLGRRQTKGQPAEEVVKATLLVGGPGGGEAAWAKSTRPWPRQKRFELARPQ